MKVVKTTFEDEQRAKRRGILETHATSTFGASQQGAGKNEEAWYQVLVCGNESHCQKTSVSLDSGDHIKLLKCFLESHVKFMLVGGHAAIYYGVNRNTGDLDILIEPTQENGLRLLDALRAMGLEIPEIDPREFERQSGIIVWS
jgi:hypothetical protein